MARQRHGPVGRCPAVVIGDLSLVRPLAFAAIPVIVAETDPGAPVMRSRLPCDRMALTDPRLDPDEALDQLMHLGRTLRDRHRQKPLIVYGSDDTLSFVYEHRQELGECFALLLNRPQTARALLHKDHFADFADRCGILVPRTLGRGRPPARLEDMAEPLIVKPRHKHGAKEAWRHELFGEAKARRYDTRKELEGDPRYAAHQGELLVQELIEVEGVTDLRSFHGFSDEACRPLAGFCGRKLRTFPATSGESALIELVDDPEVDAAGREVARRLGLVGVYKIDFMRDRRDRRLYVLEVNARYTLWHQLGAVHGVNLPAVAHRHLVEERPVPPQSLTVEPRVRWVDLYRNLQAYRHDDVPLSSLAWSLLRAPNVYTTFSWSDPRPAMGWLGDMIKRKVERAALRRDR